MFKLGWSVSTLFFFFFVKSQQVDWDRINSNTILNIIAGHQSEQIMTLSEVIQIGDSNNADLFINAKTDVLVRQIGDYNSFYFINSFTDTETKAAVTTQGNNNIIDITGSNSISDGLKMNVRGDNVTIFMRNY
ncbi:hypothetical protein HNP38_003061 [Chryseobacterium defluvii]|uniref:Curlin associated repeat-containing protein n=1 Tax=Chryseobacterium defluvii TaxID=160396 RepID=A0A840KGF0_9FLAO|nr:hypothetical protein [Chryseobacterium defluvii]MBB4807745.1 hypothetical protein [Chryseobacterium defluvii]